MIMNWYRVPATDLGRVIALDDEAITDWLFEDDRESFEVDKAWQAVTATLTGSVWDTDSLLGQAVCGGIEFGEDGGYGPARYLTPNDVAAISGALDQLSAAEFRARINLDALVQLAVYPQVWDRAEESDLNLEYVADAFATIQAGFRAAAAAGDAMVVALL